MTELVQKGTLPTLEQLDDAGKAVVVNPAGSNYTLGTAQSGASEASVRYLTPAEMRASTGLWTYSVADLVVASGESAYPLFNTFVGDATNFDMFDSISWQQKVPRLKTPGIYRVVLSVTWPATPGGTRSVEWLAADSAYTEPVGFCVDGRPRIMLSGTQMANGDTYVWDNPIEIQTTVNQDSGGPLTILKANLNVAAWKVAEFL